MKHPSLWIISLWMLLPIESQDDKPGILGINRLRGKPTLCHHESSIHRMLVDSEESTVELWDTGRGRRVTRLEGFDELGAFCYSTDRKILYTGSRLAKKVKIAAWDAVTGKLRNTLIVDVSALWQGEKPADPTDWSIQGINDAKLLVRFFRVWSSTRPSWNRHWSILDLSSGTLGRIVPLEIGERVIISPDGKRALARGANGLWRSRGGISRGGMGITRRVTLVELTELKRSAEIEIPDNPKSEIYATVWSPSGEMMATTHEDHVIRVWRASDGKLEANLIGHSDYVLSIRFSSDGERLISAGNDRSARVWDPKSGKELLKLTGHETGLNDAAFGPKDRHIITADEDGVARVWDSAGELKATLKPSGRPIHSSEFVDAERVRLVTSESRVHVVRWADGKNLEVRTEGWGLPNAEIEEIDRSTYVLTYGRCSVRERGNYTEIRVR